MLSKDQLLVKINDCQLPSYKKLWVGQTEASSAAVITCCIVPTENSGSKTIKSTLVLRPSNQLWW